MGLGSDTLPLRVVLVHGASHGEWCWSVIRPMLEQRGVRVETLDLPGLGADQTPSGLVTFEQYVNRVVEKLRSDTVPAMLVGHSMGGMVISAAAEVVPEMITRLGFICAFAPCSGDSLGSLLSSISDFPGLSAAAIARPVNNGEALEFAADAARSIFYNCCDADTASRAIDLLRPQSTIPMSAELLLSPARFGAIPSFYITCENDNAIPVAAQRWMAKRAGCSEVISLAADHSPFLSCPRELATILVSQLETVH